MAREVELEEMNIVIKVPKDVLKVTIKVQVPGYDGEVVKIKKKLLKTDLNKVRKEYPGYDMPKSELYSELEKLNYWKAGFKRQAEIAKELGFPNAEELACHIYHLSNG